LYNSMTVEFVFKVFGMANKTEICWNIAFLVQIVQQ
jgi:hypothetical protein